MLYDRPYMRDAYPRRTTSVLTWLICTLVAGFVLQMMFSEWILRGDGFERQMELSVAGLKQGRLWGLLTHVLVADHLLPLLFSALGVYFVGRELIGLIGERRMLAVFVGGAISGALLWSLTHFGQSPGVENLRGATPALLAMFTVFACFQPDRPITFLFFVVPVTLKPKWVLATIAAVDLCGFLFFEVLGSAGGGLSIAHSAHLGAMLSGWVYWRALHASSSDPLADFESRPEIDQPRWFRKAQKAPLPPPVFKVNLTDRDALRAEVDRILDKINSAGFAALTPDEKRTLDEARDLMTRR